MKARFVRFAPTFMVCVSLTHLSLRAVTAQAEEAKPAAAQVVLSVTYNAVTWILRAVAKSANGAAPFWRRRAA